MAQSNRFVRLALTIALVGGLGPLPAAGEDALAFAQCIYDSGATYYGAHWCPYCARQNAAFGDAASQLPYVECYSEGSRDKLSECAHIKSYPTWEFRDGSLHSGVQSFAKLARMTGCTPP